MKRGTRGLTISYWAGHVPTWAEVAPNGPSLGQVVCHLGAKSGQSWSQVGPSWADLGRSCGADVAAMSDSGDVGPFCNMCKLPQARALFGVPGEHVHAPRS
jgi:hypothetical protein